MKQFILLAVLSLSFNAYSQLDDGSIAPDFTLTDWNGETHNLYSYLNDDKTVFIKIFAAHCPTCWNYHQTHKLKNIYDQYGPEGSEEVMVLALEHDEYNDSTAFIGIGDPWVTQGNWLENTPYPQFNVEWPDRGVFEDYNVTFYPIIYKVCPNRVIERISTSASEELLSEKVQECQIVSVSEEKPEWNVYFNQDSKQVVVKHSQPILEFSIVNLQGQEVKSAAYVGNSEIDVNALSTGIYLFQFKTESGIIIEKLNIY